MTTGPIDRERFDDLSARLSNHAAGAMGVLEARND